MKEAKLHQLPPFDPELAETYFLGLVREAAISNFVGRASYLNDDELQSLFGVAVAAIGESSRLPSNSTKKETSAVAEGEESLRKQIQNLEFELVERDRQIAHLVERLDANRGSHK